MVLQLWPRRTLLSIAKAVERSRAHSPFAASGDDSKRERILRRSNESRVYALMTFPRKRLDLHCFCRTLAINIGRETANKHA